MSASSPPPHRVFDAVAVSSTNSYYSGATKIGPWTVPGNAVGSAPVGPIVTLAGFFTSTPNGTLTVEISNASDEDIRLGLDHWQTYTQVSGDGFTSGVATVTSGQINSSADFSIELINFGFKRIRLKYVNSSGSGTITTIINIKVLA